VASAVITTHAFHHFVTNYESVIAEWRRDRRQIQHNILYFPRDMPAQMARQLHLHCRYERRSLYTQQICGHTDPRRPLRGPRVEMLTRTCRRRDTGVLLSRILPRSCPPADQILWVGAERYWTVRITRTLWSDLIST